jgi:nitrite reductase (NO-forming)
MLHLVLLGAVTHAILVWSRHFADTLLHLAAGDRASQSRRLWLHNLGAMTIIGGVLAGLWPATRVGAGLVTTAVTWHGAALTRDLRRALPSRFSGVVRFYVAAACFLPVGAALGVLLARHPADPWHTRLLVSHVVVNLLGWVGLTVVGTLVTLWPTILRTRIAPGAERAASRALPTLVTSAVVAAVGALVGLLPVTAVGIAGYVVGLLLTARGMVEPALRKPPTSYAGWSVLAALGWLLGSLGVLTIGVATAPSWNDAGARFGWLVPLLAVGFGAQVLLGALSYLVPVALGGGPTPVRAATGALDRAAPLRVATTNAGLLVCALPVPSTVRVLASVLVLGSLAAALPLLLLAVRAARAAKARSGAGGVSAPGRRGAGRPRPGLMAAGQALTGLAAVALAVAAGLSLDSTTVATTRSAAAGAPPTGETTTIDVVAEDMRFTPSTLRVPAGNRLVVVVTNGDDHRVHDQAVDGGASTGRLAPGESERLDVGVVGRGLDGWCTVVGHREMGMVLRVEALGSPSASAAPEVSPDDAADDLDLTAEPDAGFRAREAGLPPSGRSRVHRRTITVRDEVREVAPGVTQRLWTYDGTVPGPVLHGRVGDRFVITLVNDGSIGHSIDFHAGALAPARPMRTIAPGESLRYRFRATRAGVWMYHCSTTPMSAHIANGLFGAVVVEPRGLPPADRSYVLVQSELYLGPPAGSVDPGKLAAETPDAVVFNGYASQYEHRPLPARVGERVRIWVLDAGPNRATSFHVVGGQFDTVWTEGDYLLDRRRGGGGSQTMSLGAAQGGFVEISFPEAGTYPFLSHVMVDAERGARGAFRVTR